MPGKRYGPKAMSKRRPYAGAGGPSARRIAAIARSAVRSASETKAACAAIATTALTGGAWAQPGSNVLNAVAEGDGADERDGLEIWQDKLELRVQLGTAADRPQSVRLFLVEKKSTFVSSSPFTDLPGTNVRPMIGCVTPSMLSHYRVLWDEVITCVPRLDDGSSLFRHVYVKKTIKLNRKVRFEGSGATDLEKGKIMLFAATDNLSGGTDVVDLSADCQLTYKEC